MRLIPFTALCCCALALFTGCYDITEDVSIEPSGKGVYVTNIDMGQLMSMIKTFAATDSTKDLSAFNQNIDTTIHLADISDTAAGLDPEMKQLLRPAAVHLLIRADSNVFKITLRAPFDNLGQLQKLQTEMSKNGGGMQAMGKLLGGKGNDNTGLDKASGLSPDHLNDILHTQWMDSRITRTLNRPVYDSLMKDSIMQQAKQMAALMGDAKFTTVIHLPRPAKKVDSKASILSDDRRTVTFEHSLTDLFYAPDDFTFNIDY
jgi:hypothetical protein